MKNLFFTLLGIAISIPFLGATSLSSKIAKSTFEDSPSVFFVFVDNVSCYGGADGSITTLVTGGSGNYTYQWNNGQSGANAFNLSVGLAAVTVTDVDDGSTALASIIITQPDLLIAIAILEQPINCVNPTATASVVVTGGTAFYNFIWDNGELGQTATNLTLGQHSVTITDANLCTVTDVVEVYENIEYPTATAGEDITIDCTNPNPMVTLNGMGSSEGFGITYLWFTNDGTIVANPTGLSPLVNSTGTYTLLVTNNENGCSSTDDVIVGANFEEPTADAGADIAICVGDCIEITGNGALGSPPYTFGWNQGLGLGQSHTICPTVTTTYTVTVTGENGCQGTDETTITVLPIPFLDIQSDTICQGECTTLIPVTSSIVSYEWDNDIIGQFPSVCPSVTTTYTLTITDDSGCHNTASVEIFVNEIPFVAINDSFVCFEECVELNSTIESDGPFTTLWSTGDTSQNIFVCPDATSVYTITVTNENDCQATDMATVTVNTELLAMPTEEVYYACQGSQVTACVTVTGGTPPYMYTWSNAFPSSSCITPSNITTTTIHTVTVTDANFCTAIATVLIDVILPPIITLSDTMICTGECVVLSPEVAGGTPPFMYNWSMGGVGGMETVCPAVTTTYEVVVTDALGCTAVASTTVFISSIQIDAGEDFTFPCTGTPSLTGEGSSAGSNVSFLWTATAGGIIDEGEDTAMPQVSSPGVYIFTVTNEIGCVATDTVILHSAETPIVEAAVGLISCNNADDGFIDITISGATPPYAFSWSNGSEMEDLFNLSAGTYGLTVTDAGNCASLFTIELINPAPLNVNLSTVHESAPNANDGIISANAIGGTLPYSYLWNTGDTTNVLTALAPGIYHLTLTDAHGCQFFETAQILADGCETLEVISSNNSPICPGSSDGILAINQVLGGQAPYHYNWSSGDTLAIAQNLSVGMVTCTVSDDNACIGIFSFEIIASDTIAPTLITQDIVLFLDETGMASFTFEMIDNGSNDNCQIDSVFIENTIFDCTQTGENIIDVIVFDASMLSDTTAVIITVQDTILPIFDFCPDNVISNNCSAVFYQLPSASDNCNEVTLEMTEGLPSGGHFPVGETLVTYTATDSTGNVASCAFNVTVTNDLTLTLGFLSETNMNQDGVATSAASGGTAPYSYEWTTIDGEIIGTEDTLINVAQGMYCLLLTDATGCTVMACVEIDGVVTPREGPGLFGITLSPNPATDNLNVYFSSLVNQNITIYVTNLAHQEVLKEIAMNTNWINLNTSQLSSGLYFVEIIINNYIFTEKIIITR